MLQKSQPFRFVLIAFLSFMSKFLTFPAFGVHCPRKYSNRKSSACSFKAPRGSKLPNSSPFPGSSQTNPLLAREVEGIHIHHFRPTHFSAISNAGS
ncbi:hypothetical protein FB451DRAFT_238329 [Mycena latifolia]|nr:hypothetical protein FB451DRAFT_238329 [Mycena latifolia]